MYAGGSRYEDSFEGFGMVAKLSRVSYLDRITFPTFDGFRDVHATDRGHHDFVHVLHTQPKARCFLPVHFDV